MTIALIELVAAPDANRPAALSRELYSFASPVRAGELKTLAAGMPIPPEKLHVIAELLVDYLDRPFTLSGDFREIASAESAVPTFEGWTAITFLRTDGTFFNYETEDRVGEITAENDEKWELASLRYAMEKHPRFAELLPVRPGNAPNCTFCHGEGMFLPKSGGKPSRMVCGECGGLGWQRPGLGG